jgi:hypothetical protein
MYIFPSFNCPGHTKVITGIILKEEPCDKGHNHFFNAACNYHENVDIEWLSEMLDHYYRPNNYETEMPPSITLRTSNPIKNQKSKIDLLSIFECLSHFAGFT